MLQISLFKLVNLMCFKSAQLIVFKKITIGCEVNTNIITPKLYFFGFGCFWELIVNVIMKVININLIVCIFWKKIII